MSFESDLVEGLGRLLASAGVGVWSDSAPLPGNQIALTNGELPPEPAPAVAITPYSPVDSLHDSTYRHGVQFWVRGMVRDKRSCDDLADAIYRVLQGLSQVTLSTGVFVVQCGRTSSVNLGLGEGGLWERSDNYNLTLSRPEVHNVN